MPKIKGALVALWALGMVAAPLAAQKSSNRVITAEEIERLRTSVSTAYDAVRVLRPRWLDVGREILSLPMGGSARGARLRVYIDDRDMGDVEYLKSVPAELILTMTWLSTNEAGARLGPADGPAIVITLKGLKRGS